MPINGIITQSMRLISRKNLTRWSQIGGKWFGQNGTWRRKWNRIL